VVVGRAVVAGVRAAVALGRVRGRWRLVVEEAPAKRLRGRRVVAGATARVAHRRSALSRSLSPRVRLWSDDKRIGNLRPIFSVEPFGYRWCSGFGLPLGPGSGLGLSGLGFGGLPGRCGLAPW